MSASPTCNCIAKFNKLVAETNSMLETDMLSGALAIHTVRANHVGKRRPNKPPYLLAAYCPMCGKKYRARS